MAFYKKRVVRHDTPRDVEWRHADRRAAALALAECRAKYPNLTADNLEAAIAYQRVRYQQHMQAEGF